MLKSRIEHTFDCSEDTLWNLLLLDAEFSRQLYIDSLHFPRWQILDQKVTDESLTRKVDIEPYVENVPSAVKKVVGDSFGYIEEGTFDRKAKRYRIRITPKSLGDKARIDATMFSEVLGSGSVKRIVEFEVDVKIMMVGKLIEQKIVDDTRATYEKVAAFMRRHLAEHRAG